MSSVAFPVADRNVNVYPIPFTRPFRRISLPTVPSPMCRESVISIASFDSLPEEGEAPVVRNVSHGHMVPGRLKGRVESPHRRRRRDVPRSADGPLEAKRRKVIEEFYETERTYVDGLELVYSHFLTPIIVSLDTPNPLLDRSALTTVFSNFIDIWNLHRSFFSSLSSHLLNSGITTPMLPPTPSDVPLPSLSPILLSHFPYLSIYTPFIISFATTISALNSLTSPPNTFTTNLASNSSRNARTDDSLQYNPAFATFIAEQERDPRCGKLKLRDWLLTIVQRTPRYLLLLKDLIAQTSPDDPEHAQLSTAHALVSKITLSLNTSLHTHAQTLALLALQRATPNLPFQLVIPGRTLLRRGPLVQVERAAQPREREFLLFSDCLVWLANVNAGAEGEWGIGMGWSGPNTNPNSPVNGEPGMRGPRAPVAMTRTRSKSEAELSLLRDQTRDTTPMPTPTPVTSPPPSMPSSPSKRTYANAQKSYSLHPPVPAPQPRRHPSDGAAEERWMYKGRAELVDLEIIVSASMGGMREGEAYGEGGERRFEVLSPQGSFVVYAASEDERNSWSSAIRQAKAQLLVSLNITHPHSTLASSSSTAHLRRSLQALPFPPEVPTKGRAQKDVTTYSGSETATGTGKGKDKGDEGKRRKVEHWVPAIWIPDEKTSACMRCGRPFGWRRRRHHCRLCGRCVCAACSGRTFFISDPAKKHESEPARACDACYETVFPFIDAPDGSTDDYNHRAMNTDTLGTLSGFPSWLSMPALPVTANAVPVPQALMAINLNHDREREHVMSRIVVEYPKGRARMRSRPRSYHQILEDFNSDQDRGIDVVNVPLEEGERESEVEEEEGGRPAPSPRKENTARRVKRFSLPAVAVQTTSVVARTGFVDDQAAVGGTKMNKRFSLVLGGKHGHRKGYSGGRKDHDVEGERDGGGDGKETEKEAGISVAAARLSELLGRRK